LKLKGQKNDMVLEQSSFRISVSKALVALLFLLALISSPSILRGFVNEAMIFIAALLLLTLLAVKARIYASPPLLVTWAIAFFAMSVTSIYYSSYMWQGMKPFAGVFGLLVLLLLSGWLAEESFSEHLTKWWRRFFWITSVSSIITWMASFIAPAWFVPFQYGELYAGNVRTYFVSPIGAYILQDYGSFALHRVVGILAEPGMMSMLFAINACLGLLHTNRFFSRWFGVVNLAAGFTTDSVAYYLALTVLIIYMVLAKHGYRLIAIIVICAVFLLVNIDMGSITEMLGYFEERSSFHHREGGLKELFAIILANPEGLLFGYVWYDLPETYPSTILQLVFQCGLIGTVAYLYYIATFLRKSPEILLVFLTYAMTTQWHVYFINILSLIMAGACTQAVKCAGNGVSNRIAMKSTTIYAPTHQNNTILGSL